MIGLHYLGFFHTSLDMLLIWNVRTQNNVWRSVLWTSLFCHLITEGKYIRWMQVVCFHRSTNCVWYCFLIVLEWTSTRFSLRPFTCGKNWCKTSIIGKCKYGLQLRDYRLTVLIKKILFVTQSNLNVRRNRLNNLYFYKV